MKKGNFSKKAVQFHSIRYCCTEIWINTICFKKYKANSHTAQKMRFSIKNFCSKCDQIHDFLRIWLHLLKMTLLEKFIFLRGGVHIENDIYYKFMKIILHISHIQHTDTTYCYLVTRSLLQYILAPDLLESSHLYYVHTRHRNCTHSVLAYLVYHLKDGKDGLDENLLL